MSYGYASLDEVTGVGKTVVLRDKLTARPFVIGVVEDEVSIMDGENKHFIQLVRLNGAMCEGDATRYVLRIGYYTRRSDGRFCLGSQYAPILTPNELLALLSAMTEKGWLIQKN